MDKPAPAISTLSPVSQVPVNVAEALCELPDAGVLIASGVGAVVSKVILSVLVAFKT